MTWGKLYHRRPLLSNHLMLFMPWSLKRDCPGSFAQAITRARILLKVDEGWRAAQVATSLDISERTVIRAGKRYAQEGLEETLHRRNQAYRYRKVDERGEAHLTALACSPAPRATTTGSWRHLAGETVELGLVES